MLSRFTVLFFALFFTLSAFAQLRLSQSTPKISWKKIDTQDFKIIYPDYIEHKAQYIYRLLENYKESLAKSYQLTPKKFTLIIRPEFSLPNGFVTYGPLRSEWYSNANITPSTATVEWYQTLAVHEYRHIIQFQNLNKNYMRFAYYLLGESGLALTNVITQPNWFFEGDAVWAETVLTNGGRGRSPRFSSRLKALALSDKLPSYDELIGGNFKTSLPNHYVYGYYLTTQGYNQYGEDFWYKVTDRTTYSPLNPFAFTSAFDEKAKIGFDSFAQSTFHKIQSEWKKEKGSKKDIKPLFQSKEIKDDMQYESAAYPFFKGNTAFYLYKNLDTHWELRSFNSKNQKIKTLEEFDLNPRISKISLSEKYLIYSRLEPDTRYGFKSRNNLYLYDIEKKEKRRLTSGRRLYHPSLRKNKILATEFTDQNTWQISIFNLQGKILQSLDFVDFIMTEAIWLTDTKIVSILSHKSGEKSIAIIDINTLDKVDLTAKTNANLFSLNTYGNKIYFESDLKGTVQILSIDTSTKKLYQCTDESIAAFNPFATSNHLYYIAERANGRALVKNQLACKNISPSLLKGTNHLGKTVSDYFFKTEPVELKELSKETQKTSSYNSISDGMRAHSWSFIGSRGYQFGLQTVNELGTLSFNPTIGKNSSEEKPYANFSLAYSKYYPIISLFSEYAERKTTYNNNTLEDSWFESQAFLRISLPYLKTFGLYTFNTSLFTDYGELKTSKRKVRKIYEFDDATLQIQSVGFNNSLLKRPTSRELAPSLGYKLSTLYKDGQSKKTKAQNSFLFSGKFDLYLPSVVENHGLKLSYTREIRPEKQTAYRFFNPSALIGLNYIYSRGYEYTFAPSFEKMSADYFFPLSYERWRFRDWVYINRLAVNLFYDRTNIFTPTFRNDDGTIAENLQSFGFELSFNTLLMRKLPLVIGYRSSYVENPSETISDIFINLPLLF